MNNNGYQTLNGNHANENANYSNVNAPGVLLGSVNDPTIKSEIREVRQSLDHIYQ